MLDRMKKYKKQVNISCLMGLVSFGLILYSIAIAKDIASLVVGTILLSMFTASAPVVS